MYFAILGKNREISLKELEKVFPQNIKHISNEVISFTTNTPEQLSSLAGIIKWGRVVDTTKIDEICIKLAEEKKIIGINEKDLGVFLKKEFRLKRFKLTKLNRTDIEIKKKWQEFVYVPYSKKSKTIKDEDTIIIDGFLGEVKGYQNIKMYEVIDFDKPDRDMKVGMMPTKLAHILLNIALATNAANKTNKKQDAENVTIYDPFIGGGTTGLLANALGYNFIWSDKDISHAEKNFARWSQHPKFHKEKEFSFFEHDAILPFWNKVESNNPPIIVSEWRLGPIVHRHTTKTQVEEYQGQVFKMYTSFFKNIAQKFKHNSPTIVITIPYYIKQNNFLAHQLQQNCERLGFNFNVLEEIYQRKDQKVGRQILILS